MFFFVFSIIILYLVIKEWKASFKFYYFRWNIYSVYFHNQPFSEQDTDMDTIDKRILVFQSLGLV
jgi:hypothetical protein